MDIINDIADNNVPEEILIEVPDVTVKKDDVNNQDFGKGKLVLTSNLVTWTGNSEEMTWDYRSILMHAISKEGDVPTLYTQMKGDNEFDLVEIRFVPENSAVLDDLYAAFSRGACLNPDEPEDEGEAGNFYFNVEQAHAELNGEEEDGEFEEDGEENGAE